MCNSIAVKQIICGPISVNTYVLFIPETDNCIVIDPGESDTILKFLEKNHKICSNILLTHGHFDHILGLSGLINCFSPQVFIHEDDREMIRSSNNSLADLFGFHYTPVEDCTVITQEFLNVDGIDFHVVHTPGHSPGSVIFCLEKDNLAFCGDTIFRYSIGRFDLPGGNETQLIKSAKSFLAFHADNMILYPGHGIRTTVKEEKEFNYYLR